MKAIEPILSYTVLSIIISTFIRFGLSIAFGVHASLLGLVLLLQAFIVILSWIKFIFKL